MKIFKNDMIFKLYGLWNGLVFKDINGNVKGWIPAHDGDFFPNLHLIMSEQ